MDEPNVALSYNEILLIIKRNDVSSHKKTWMNIGKYS